MKPKTSTASTDTQTSADDEDSVLISCNLCIYAATCEEELTWHMGEDHGKDTNYFDSGFHCDICGKWCRSDEDLAHHMVKHETMNINREGNSHQFSSETIQCHFCDKTFQTKGKLMKHRKKDHSDKVSPCWKHVQEICEFSDPSCWFIHSDSISSSKIVCNDCNETFSIQPLYRMHRKQHHSSSVPLCKNITNGGCTYGKHTCWFIHNDIKENINHEQTEKTNDNNRVIQQLFTIKEKMTERITQLEK